MNLVVDANILIYINGFGIWDEIVDLLARCELTLITIESVHRRELPDSLRLRIDEIIDAGHIGLQTDPDKVAQVPKRTRKLRQKIVRAAKKCPPTSSNDQQLLLVALRDEIPLLTDENPLQRLAASCNALRYNLLDIIDGLCVGEAIDEIKKEQLLSANPGGRNDSPAELQKFLDNRRGEERFFCQKLENNSSETE